MISKDQILNALQRLGVQFAGKDNDNRQWSVGDLATDLAGVFGEVLPREIDVDVGTLKIEAKGDNGLPIPGYKACVTIDGKAQNITKLTLYIDVNDAIRATIEQLVV